MKSPGLPEHEEQRLQDLYELEILEVSHNLILDSIVELATKLCQVPISAISLVDEKRQYFKASLGLSVKETSRDVSFCGHAILGSDMFVVENAKEDIRFHDNPLVDGDLHLRFYAGVPLISPNDHALGTLCIMDQQPRLITDDQRSALQTLGKLVSQELELIRRLRKEERLLQTLEKQIENHQTLLREHTLLLENTRVGILVVDSHLIIQKGYTPYAENILESSDLEGRSLDAILLSYLDMNSEEISRISNALRYSIGAEDMFFEANTGWLPQELKVDLPKGRKVLHAEWSPFKYPGSDVVEKVIVSLHDVTRLHNLEKEAEEGRKQKRLLDELIAIGPAAFNIFHLRLQANLAGIGSLLQLGEQQKSLDGSARDRIYALFHTTKGSARLLGLSEISHQVHLAEDMLKHRQKLALRDIRALQYGLDEIRMALADYHRALEPIQRLIDLMDHQSAEDKCSLRELLEDIMPLADKLALSKGKGGLKLAWECEDEIPLEANVAEALSKSLIHLVRNTIDHGIEMPDKREQKRKPAHGTFRVFRDGQARVCFQDDGAGLSLSRLRKKANELGYAPKNVKELAELIFINGLSTAESIDQDSGRGVGMDAVRMFLREAGSDLELVPLHEDGDALFFYFALIKADESL